MSAEQLLREVADPYDTLPYVELTYQGHSIDQDRYAAYSDNEQIGEMKLGARNTGEPFVVQGSGIDERFRGQGYGLAMYLGAAALAYESGYRLMSDVMVSRDAARLWGRLERRGLARIWEPFQWRDTERYSVRGRAQFVPPEELSLRDPAPHVVDSADIWQRM